MDPKKLLSLIAAAAFVLFSSVSAAADTVIAIKAEYDEGILKNVTGYETDESELDSFIEKAELGLNDKLFIWYSFKGMKPYMVSVAPTGDIKIMTASLNSDNDIILTKNFVTGETKVWQKLIGDQRVQLRTDTFAYDDTGYKYGDTLTINSIAVYKNRVYAGCDGGKVIVFTACSKCYQLRRVCDFDIKTMEITNGIMTVSDGTEEKITDMADIGADQIEANEALELYAKGARLIDVRTAEEFAERSYPGSVNIPLSGLKEALDEYDADDVLIFYCVSGVRAAEAISEAKAAGFINVYNLGSIDKLL